MDAYFAAPKLAWLLAAEPDVRRRAGGILMANGYVVRRLTGAVVCDTGHAGLTLLTDLAATAWSPDLVDLWGVPRSWLPDLAAPAAVVGRVTTEAAGATGLCPGTPVVAGVVDGAAASLAAGVARHGDLCEMTGQSTVLNACVATDWLAGAASADPLSVLPYPVPGHHLVYGSMVATGGILRWFRDEFGDRPRPGEHDVGRSDADVFVALDDLAGTAAPGSGGLLLLPYFLGERSPIWDVDARGALVGLSMATRRAEVVRAILEGTAYGLAHNLDELRRLGLRPRSLPCVGGGARGRTWTAIKADVTGLPVEVRSGGYGAPVGAALVAAAGVGLVSDLAATVRARATTTAWVRPDPDRHAAYAGYYAAYRALYPALRQTYDRLAVLRGRP
jgi:xylulokinase